MLLLIILTIITTILYTALFLLLLILQMINLLFFIMEIRVEWVLYQLKYLFLCSILPHHSFFFWLSYIDI